jgi:hypothetical protein
MKQSIGARLRMDLKIKVIKAAFFINFFAIGDNKEQILDELDIAIYQHRDLRDTPTHDALLIWADNFLSAAGIK